VESKQEVSNNCYVFSKRAAFFAGIKSKVGHIMSTQWVVVVVMVMVVVVVVVEAEIKNEVAHAN